MKPGEPQLRRNLHHATRGIRAKRNAVVAEVPDWEELRAAGEAIKRGAMRRLDVLLEELEAAVQAGRRPRALGPRRRPRPTPSWATSWPPTTRARWSRSSR